MSRCYLTRHGAGPFENELFEKPYSGIADLTNIHNEFQGSLRFGYLDFDLLCFEINKDLKNLVLPANVNVTFTCLDQVGAEVKYLQDNEVRTVKSNEFLNMAWSILSARIDGLYGICATCGLTRDDIIVYEQNKTVAYA